MSRRIGLKIKSIPKVETKKEEVKEQPKKEIKEEK